MPIRRIDSPLLHAFLRALTFVGLTESIFLRLVPAPNAAWSGTLAGRIHDNLHAAGRFTFMLAFFLVTITLVNVSSRMLRQRIWPDGANGFLAFCLVCLAALGVVAFAFGLGPTVAAGYTVMALVAALTLAMHEFARSGSAWVKAFVVSYCGALVCSAVAALARAAGDFPIIGGGDALLSEAAVTGGQVLFAGAGVMSFLAYFDFGASRGGTTGLAGLPLILGTVTGGGFAIACLLAPDRLALLGPHPSPVRVMFLASSLLLASMTVSSCLLRPDRRLVGYGLLMMLLAGFPLRVAYQHMMMALGMILAMAPPPVVVPEATFVSLEPVGGEATEARMGPSVH